MRKYLIFLIFTLIVILIISCKDDGEITGLNPTIEFLTDSGYTWKDTMLHAGASIKIGISATSLSTVPLTHFNYTIQGEEDTLSIDSGIYTQDFTYHKIITKSFSDFENWTFTVHDKDGRPAALTLNLLKSDSSDYGEIISINSIILGAQNNSSVGSFYSWDNQQVFHLDEAYNNQEKVNLLFYYDLIESDEHTIASPAANIDPSVYSGNHGLINWDTKNLVRFQITSIDQNDFYTCINDSLIIATSFDFNSGKRKAKNLKPGDIYAFNNNSKMGLFIVKQVDGNETGTIKIDIRIQE